MSLLDDALACLRAGVSIVPIDHSTKRPLNRLLPKGSDGKPHWEPYKEHQVDERTALTWFGPGGAQAFAVVCGKVSGGLCCIDFDAQARRLCPAWREAVGTLADDLPVQQTGGGEGRVQVFFRCPNPGGNQKLAWVVDGDNPGGREIAIETRGEGGYAIVPSSLHPSGRRYAWVHGDLTSVPTLSQAQADTLLEAARRLDECPYSAQDRDRREKEALKAHQKQARAGDTSVIELYNRTHPIEQALTTRGYTPAPGGRLDRPGGKGGSVAIKDGKSFHWSSNDPLNCRPGAPGCTCQDSFGVFSHYEHGGDVKRAVKAAAAELGMATGRSAQPPESHCTDIGNAARLVLRAGADWRWCGPWGKWLHWDGTRWGPDESQGIVRVCKEVALGLFDEAKRATTDWERKELGRWAVTSQKRERLAAMEALAKCDLSVLPAQLDSDPWLLNIENGTLDLRVGTLHEHRQADLITKLAPVRFDAAATCPQWKAFLDRIMNRDAGLIAYIQRIAGLCLTGDVREQVLFIAYGVGANGKSTLLDTLCGMLGDYAAEAAPDLLIVRKSSEHPTEVADLCGRRLVVASENEEGSRLKIQLIKRLTGNAKLKARFMHRDFFQFDRTHKLILATNNKPTIRESTHAAWRRLRLIPFNVVIPDDKQDKTLGEKLKAEWSGILRWAVEGCLAWQAKGLATPTAVTDATQAYHDEQDPLAEFLSDWCIIAPNAFIARAELFGAYQRWATREKEQNPLSRTQVYDRVRGMTGIQDVSKRVNGQPARGFEGIGLVHEPEVVPSGGEF